jgi:hypothetical protein
VIWQRRGALRGSAVGIQLVGNTPKLVVASEEGDIHLLDVCLVESILRFHSVLSFLECNFPSKQTFIYV